MAALFENLRDGATVEELSEWFASVERAQVAVVLDQQLERLARVRGG